MHPGTEDCLSPRRTLRALKDQALASALDPGQGNFGLTATDIPFPLDSHQSLRPWSWPTHYPEKGWVCRYRAGVARVTFYFLPSRLSAESLT